MSGTFSSPDLDEIVEEFTRQCRSAERPSVEDFAQRYPEHAEEIRDLFPTLLAMEQAAPESEDELDQTSDGQQSSSTLKASRPERLGDYRIIREIGRGGMGVVYEAEQESLGRHVALKILPQQVMSDSKQRRRFTREARAAARLHHTNIVPVFGVGEADGISFYAMQFIPDMPLNEVLDAIRQQGSDIAAAVSDATRKRDIDGKYEQATASKLAFSMLSGQFAAPEIPDSPSGSSVVLDQTVEGNPTSTQRERVDTDAEVRDPLAGASSSYGSGGNTSTRRQQVVSNVDRTDPLAGASSSYESEGNTSSQRQQVDPGTDSALSGSDILSAGNSSVSRSRSKKAYWESVARIGQQAAEALGYAHSQGVIHRDIKPGNLLLDLAGIVWITDFGLAKAEEEDDLTKTGDVLGTLRYMPPEALKGQADATSDIFSLGLTLYELVARRPAYDENDRHGLLKRITEAEVTPLRTLDRSVPRDLETIIHKSVAADPKDRYQDAGEMAADLERFLADDPIHARRMSLPERFTRWSRRNPVIAGLGAACTALLLAISLVSTFAYIHTNDALDLAEQREVAARTAQEQAEVAREESDSARDRAEETTYRRNVSLAISQWREGHSGTGLQLLDECPVEKRAIEWRLTKNLFSQYDWKVSVNSHDMAVFANGKSFALAVDDGISIRSLQDGAEIQHVKFPGVIGVYSHPQQSLLVVTDSTGTLYVVSPQGEITLQREMAVKSTKQIPWGINNVAFSPKHDLIAVVGAGETNIEVATWPEIKSLWTANGDKTQSSSRGLLVNCAAFSPDGDHLVTCSESGDIIRWDVGKGLDPIANPQPRDIWKTTASHAIDISADGKQLLLGQVNSIISLLSVADGSNMILGRHRGSGASRSVKFLNGNQLAASGTTDNSLNVWNLRTREREQVLIGHHSEIRKIHELVDGSLISMGYEAVIRWPRPRQRHSEQRIAFHPNEPWMAISEKGKIRIDDLDSRLATQHPQMTVHHPVQLIRFSPDGKLLVASGPNGGSVWDWRAGVQVAKFDDPQHHIDGFTQMGPWFTADGKYLIYIREDGELVVLYVETGTPVVLPLNLRKTTRRCIAVAPRSRLAAAVFDDQITVFDPVEGTVVTTIPTIYKRNGAAGFSPDEKLLLIGYSRQIEIFDVETGERVKQLGRHWGAFSAMAFSRDGTRLATGGTDCEVNLWEWPSAEHLLRLESDTRVSNIEFDCHDHWIQASGYAGKLNRLWDARPGEETVDALIQYAIKSAEQGQIQNAIAAVKEAASRSKQPLKNRPLLKTFVSSEEWQGALLLTPESSDSEAWLERASLQFLTGDLDGYRERCKTLLGLFGNTVEGTGSERLLRSCTLTPEVFDCKLMEEIAHMMVQWIDEDGIRGPSLLAKGKSDFRLGLYESAIEWLENCIQRIDSSSEKSHLPMKSTARYFIAMSHDRLGDREAAKKWLAEAAQIAEKYELDANPIVATVADTLEYRITRREAETQINSPPLAFVPFDTQAVEDRQ